uniref:flagellar hook-length control protein FliK n=1 Tax=Polynucleobacter sp. TaxID=2029855 RepID=UPI0040483E26
LENQSLRWAGTIWPGQWMEWQLGYDPEESAQENSDEPVHTIVSEIEIDLPRLGKVRIQLKMSSEQVLSVSMQAEKPQTENLLQTEMPTLRSTFQDQGQSLDVIEVVQRG